jgi:hypothetical protein
MKNAGAAEGHSPLLLLIMILLLIPLETENQD